MALLKKLNIKAKPEINTGFGVNSSDYGGRFVNKNGTNFLCLKKYKEYPLIGMAGYFNFNTSNFFKFYNYFINC